MNPATLSEPFLFALPMLLIGGMSLSKLRSPKKVNLLRIFIVAFTLHFGAMPLYAFPIEWLAGSWPYTSEEIWSAYLNLYIFLAGVMLAMFLYDLSPKRFRRGWTIPQLLEQQYKSIPTTQAVLYFGVIMGFLVGYNIYFGFTYYASGTLERNLAVPYPVLVLKSFANIFVYGLIGYGALHLIRGKKLMLLGVLLLSSNIFLDVYARRNYIFAIVLLVVFKLLLDKFRIPLRQVVIVGAAGLALFQVFFPFLFVFRQLTTEAAHSNQGTTDLSRTYEISQGSRGQLLEKGVDANVAYRANQIARNIELMRFPGPEGKYMNGLLFASQAAIVIPRALNPAKIQGGIALAPEAVVLLYYGHSGFDMADNLPLYGYLEFGYFGAFAVGLLQALLLIIFERFAFRFQRIHPFLGLSVLMFALYNHLSLEYPYSQELSLLREMILLFFIVWPFLLLSRFVSRKKTSAIEAESAGAPIPPNQVEQ